MYLTHADVIRANLIRENMIQANIDGNSSKVCSENIALKCKLFDGTVGNMRAKKPKDNTGIRVVQNRNTQKLTRSVVFKDTDNNQNNFCSTNLQNFECAFEDFFNSLGPKVGCLNLFDTSHKIE
jgi:hypothetical protein